MEEEWGQLTGLRGDLKNGKVGDREMERWSEGNREIHRQWNLTTKRLHFVFYIQHANTPGKSKKANSENKM